MAGEGATIVAGCYERFVFGLSWDPSLAAVSNPCPTSRPEDAQARPEEAAGDAVQAGDPGEGPPGSRQDAAGGSLSAPGSRGVRRRKGGDSRSRGAVHRGFSYAAHAGSVRCVAALGSVAVSGGADDVVRVYDLASCTDMGSLVHHSGAVNSLQLYSPGDSAQPSHMLSASEDGTVALWDARKWRVLLPLLGHKAPVHAVAVHPSGRVALSACAGGGLRMWNLVRGRCAFRTRLPREATLVQYAGEQGDTYALAARDWVELHSSLTGALISSLPVAPGAALCVAYLHDGMLATGGEDKAVSLWDLRVPLKPAVCLPSRAVGSVSAEPLGLGGEPRPWGRLHVGGRVKGVARVPGSGCGGPPGLVASGTSQGVVQVWDARVAEEAGALPGPAHEPGSSRGCLGETSTGARLTCLVATSRTTVPTTPTLARPRDATAVAEPDTHLVPSTPGKSPGSIVHRSQEGHGPKSSVVVATRPESGAKSNVVRRDKKEAFDASNVSVIVSPVGKRRKQVLEA